MKARTYLFPVYLALFAAPTARACEGPYPVIFVPGIKGSALSSPKRGQIWVSKMAASGLVSPTLDLPTVWKNGEQASDDLKPSGILDYFHIIPHLASIDIYGTTLKTLKKTGYCIHEFSYDWRRDNLESLEKLAAFAKQVLREAGRSKFILVGHSMGGLLSVALANRQPEQVAGLILGGVPLRGNLSFLPDLQNGGRVGLNLSVLSASTLATFPAVFSLFPFTECHCVKDASGTEVASKFESVEFWSQMKLGPFQKTYVTPDFPEFFRETLDHASRFRGLAQFRQTPNYPLKVFMGIGRPTFTTVTRTRKDGWDFDSAPREDGDGRVAKTELPPDSVTYRLFTNTLEHQHVLEDARVVEMLREMEN